MNIERKEKLVNELIALSDNKNFFAKTGEQFSGDKHCIIWTTLEEPFKDGLELYTDEYNSEEHPIFKKFLKRHKLFAEPYDPGTLMIYKDN